MLLQIFHRTRQLFFGQLRMRTRSHPRRLALRELQQFAVAQQVRDAEIRHAGLARCRKILRARRRRSSSAISKPLVVFTNGVEALLGFGSHRLLLSVMSTQYDFAVRARCARRS